MSSLLSWGGRGAGQDPPGGLGPAEGQPVVSTRDARPPEPKDCGAGEVVEGRARVRVSPHVLHPWGPLHCLTALRAAWSKSIPGPGAFTQELLTPRAQPSPGAAQGLGRLWVTMGSRWWPSCCDFRVPKTGWPLWSPGACHAPPLGAGLVYGVPEQRQHPAGCLVPGLSPHGDQLHIPNPRRGSGRSPQHWAPPQGCHRSWWSH